MSGVADLPLEEIRRAIGAIMCPPSHDAEAGIFPDGLRCYVCMCRALLSEVTAQRERADEAERKLSQAEQECGQAWTEYNDAEADLSRAEAVVVGLRERAERLEEALRDVLAIIGPEPASCCKCEGCRAEIHEAIRIAREAVGGALLVSPRTEEGAE